MTTARNAALAEALLAHVAGTDRPLAALWGLIEETLDAAAARFATHPSCRPRHSERSRSWDYTPGGRRLCGNVIVEELASKWEWKTPPRGRPHPAAAAAPLP